MVGGYYLDGDGFQAHDWVEIKLNDSVWWPLEPQTDGEALPRPANVPVLAGAAYDVHNEGELDSVATYFAKIDRYISTAKFSAAP